MTPENKRLWKLPVTVDQLNQVSKKTIHDALGIQFTAVGDDFLEAVMPVDSRTHQPAGLLHGGASAVLAESLGSVASFLIASSQEKSCVGLEINASHLRGVKSGTVTGRVTPIRIGQAIHVWNIHIYDTSNSQGVILSENDGSETSPLVCQSRLTVMIKDQKG